MGNGEAKQIIYRYHGVESTDEIVPDPLGELDIPEKGSIVQRHGREWKVAHTTIEVTIAGPPALPIHRVFLIEKTK
jgi:hypothetical protein